MKVIRENSSANDVMTQVRAGRFLGTYFGDRFSAMHKTRMCRHQHKQNRAFKFLQCTLPYKRSAGIGRFFIHGHQKWPQLQRLQLLRFYLFMKDASLTSSYPSGVHVPYIEGLSCCQFQTVRCQFREHLSINPSFVMVDMSTLDCFHEWNRIGNI